MTTSDRTIVVPISGCLSNMSFSFPCKYNNEILDYTVDLRAWLAINDLTLIGCFVTTSHSLTVVNQNFMVRNSVNVGIQLELSQGNPGLTESILLRLTFAQGDVADILIKLPIATLPSGLNAAVPGTLAIGDMSLSIGGVYLAGFTN